MGYGRIRRPRYARPPIQAEDAHVSAWRWRFGSEVPGLAGGEVVVAAGVAASAFGVAAAALLGIYGVMVLIFGAIVVSTSRRG